MKATAVRFWRSGAGAAEGHGRKLPDGTQQRAQHVGAEVSRVLALGNFLDGAKFVDAGVADEDIELSVGGRGDREITPSATTTALAT